MQMNYRQLGEQIAKMSPEHQEQTATMFVPGVDEYYSVTVAYTDDSCDVLDPNHAVLTPE
jgi:hypothetical protein